MQQDESQKRRNSHLLRLLVGFVILYYSYSLYGNLADAEGTKWYVLLIFAILFLGAAAAMIIGGLAGLIKYKKQMMTAEVTGGEETVSKTEEKAEETVSKTEEEAKETVSKTEEKTKSRD